MAWTGLPGIEQTQRVRPQGVSPLPGIPDLGGQSAAQASQTAASAWGSIARSTEALSNDLDRWAAQSVAGQIAAAEQQHRLRALELQNQFATDPQGFQTAWRGYTEGVMADTGPATAGHMQTLLQREGNQAYASILGARREQDRRVSMDSLQQRASSSADRLMGYAAGGQLGSNEAVRELNDFHDIMQTGAHLGFWSTDHAGITSERLVSQATAAQGVSHIMDVYRTSGIAAAQRAAEDVYRDPRLLLTPEQRYEGPIRAMRQVREAVSENRAALSQFVQDSGVQDLIYGLHDGQDVPDSVIDQTIGRLNSFGPSGQALAARLSQARVSNRTAHDIASAPLEAIPGLVRQASLGGAPGVPSEARTNFSLPREITRTSAGFETNNPLDLRGDPQRPNYWHGQVGLSAAYPGAGRFAQFSNPENGIRAGAINLVTQIQSGADTPLALANRLAPANDPEDTAGVNNPPVIARRIASSLGIGINDRIDLTDPAAHRRLVETLIVNENGSNPYPPEVITAAMERARDYLGLPTGRTESSGQGVALQQGEPPAATGPGGAPTAGTAPQGPPQDYRTAHVAQAAASERLRAAWGPIEHQLDEGVRPPDETISNLMELATGVGDYALVGRMQDRLHRYATREELAALPGPQRSQAQTTLAAQNTAGGLPPDQADALSMLQANGSRWQTEFRDDPLSFRARHNPDMIGLGSIDWNSQPENTAQQISTRQNMARTVEQYDRVGPVSVLTADEMRQFRAAWDQSPTENRVAMLRALQGNLDQPHFMATIHAVTQGEGAGSTTAVLRQAASLSDQPGVAESVIRGHTLLAADHRIAPPEDRTWNDALDSRVGQALMMSAEARGDMMGAIRARYADLSAVAGDSGGILNDSRLQQAVTDVTGGIVRWNGQSVLAPVRGMSQRQFDQVMNSLTDADLSGVTDLAGRPVRAETLRRWGTLRETSTGYFVDVQGGFLQRDGAPFVLDLSAISRARQASSTPPWLPADWQARYSAP